MRHFEPVVHQIMRKSLILMIKRPVVAEEMLFYNLSYCGGEDRPVVFIASAHRGGAEALQEAGVQSRIGSRNETIVRIFRGAHDYLIDIEVCLLPTGQG